MKANTSLPFKEALLVWIKVAVNSFGGPAGQIAVMHKLLVEEKKWISESRFLHALNYCMLLPGPEAQQLATYIGWLLHKTKGGLVAGLLFILPGFITILILSVLYASYQEVTFVQALFYGIKPAVLAIVVGALIKIGKRALHSRTMYMIAITAFAAIFFFKVDFPLIVIAAGLIGFAGRRYYPNLIRTTQKQQATESDDRYADRYLQSEKPSLAGLVKTILVFGALWMLPFILILILGGGQGIFLKEALFFSKSAVVTFGGAYAVLAYIAQAAVDSYGWLKPGEMLDGLGMAETTPGPLIQVVQFVGFMGAYRFPGSLDPLVAGIIGSVLVTWVTFVPCFLFIFAGAPFIESLRNNQTLSAALSAITAAVVGVVLNLGVWFSVNTLFRQVNEIQLWGIHLLSPVMSTLDIGALLLALLGFVFYFPLKFSMIKTIALCAGLGTLLYFAVY